MRKHWLPWMLLLMACAAAPAQALEIDHVALPDTVRPSPGGPVLRLNGAGMRTKFFFDIYVAALYLRQPATSAAAVLRDPGPKRMIMHFVYRAISHGQLVSAWNEGFADNTPAPERERLQPRIDAFERLFPAVKRGDEVWLDFLPDGGTRVSLNGTALGTIPGEDFQQALLRVWLGDAPPSTALKRELLGAER